MAKNGRNGKTLGKKILRKTLKVFRNVLIKIPKSSKFMYFVPENKRRKIAPHWKNGHVIDKSGVLVDDSENFVLHKEILYRFFYGITEADLGSCIVADVKVVEKKIVVKSEIFGKIVESEIDYLYLDVEKVKRGTVNQGANKKMKFWPCNPEVEVEEKNEFFIPRTQEKIVFLGLKKEEDAA